MSLIVPIDFAAVKQQQQQHSHLCTDGSASEFSLAPRGRIQPNGLPPARMIPVTNFMSTIVPPVYLSTSARADNLTDGFSKSVAHNNHQHHHHHHHRHRGGSSNSYHGYVGLPYQDHNYVQIPPSTPPLSPICPVPGLPPPPPPPSLPLPLHSPFSKSHGNGLCNIDNISFNTTVVTTTTDDSVTRCICEFQHDDGYMIQCDKCSVWQHVDCMEVDRNDIPENYLCEVCGPRKVDKHKAIQIQTRKRDAFSLQRVDSSATETEDETTDGRRRSFDKSPVKRETKDGASLLSSSTGSLTRKRKPRSKRDERLKRKLQLKRQASGGGQKLSLSSPKKNFCSQLSLDSFSGIARQETTTLQSNFVVTALTTTSLAHNMQNQSAAEVYREAVCNLYTAELQNLLASIKFNGQQVAACMPSAFEKLQFGQSCLVAPVNSTRMGLEACEDILTNQPLIEYIGKVMLRDQYEKDDLFYACGEPNVLFYSKLGGLDLCIDASCYGNIARFVRRSCTPNAEVRHLLEGCTVRFFIYATKSIVRGAEITISFDFNYHKCRYQLDCACTRVSCPVARFQRRESNPGPVGRNKRSARSLETMPQSDVNVLSPKKLQTSSSSLSVSKQNKVSATQNHVSVDDEIVKTEIKCESSLVKTEPLTPLSPVRPVICSTPATAVLENDQAAASSASSNSISALDGGDDGDKSKKKTREEKKLEAIIKEIERMEKREEKKKGAKSRHEINRRSSEPSKSRESFNKQKNKMDVKNERTAEIVKMESVSPDVVDRRSLNVKDRPTVKTSSALSLKSETKNRIKKPRQKLSSRRASMSILASVAAAAAAASVPYVPAAETTSYHHQSSSCLANATSTAVGTFVAATNGAGSAPAPSLGSSSFSVAAAAVAAVSMETVTALTSVDRLMGHPKKLLMRQQDVNKQPNVRTDVQEPVGSDGEFGSEFVQCVPRPDSRSLITLRRNSVPATSVNCVSGTTIAAPTSLQSETKGCSAKKRWLQQAMCDKTELRTISEDAIPNDDGFINVNINDVSSSDIVTPLKKRRLAREMLSTESPDGLAYFDGYGDRETGAASDVVVPQYESISDDDHSDVDALLNDCRRNVFNNVRNNEGSGDLETVGKRSEEVVSKLRTYEATPDAGKRRQWPSVDVGNSSVATPSAAEPLRSVGGGGRLEVDCQRDRENDIDDDENVVAASLLSMASTILFSSASSPIGASSSASVPNDAFSSASVPNNAFSSASVPNNAFLSASVTNNAFSSASVPNNAFLSTSAPIGAFSSASVPNNTFSSSSVPNDTFLSASVPVKAALSDATFTEISRSVAEDRIGDKVGTFDMYRFPCDHASEVQVPAQQQQHQQQVPVQQRHQQQIPAQQRHQQVPAQQHQQQQQVPVQQQQREEEDRLCDRSQEEEEERHVLDGSYFGSSPQRRRQILATDADDDDVRPSFSSIFLEGSSRVSDSDPVAGTAGSARTVTRTMPFASNVLTPAKRLSVTEENNDELNDGETATPADVVGFDSGVFGDFRSGGDKGINFAAFSSDGRELHRQSPLKNQPYGERVEDDMGRENGELTTAPDDLSSISSPSRTSGHLAESAFSKASSSVDSLHLAFVAEGDDDDDNRGGANASADRTEMRANDDERIGDFDGDDVNTERIVVGVDPTTAVVSSSAFMTSDAGGCPSTTTTDNFNLPVSPSSSFSSPPSGGHCLSKRKVSLVEYRSRMRQRSSDGSSANNCSKSSGGGTSTDSDTSMSTSFDAAVVSPPPVRQSASSSSSSPLQDKDKDGVDGGSWSVSWNIMATAAEKTLENLQSNERHLKAADPSWASSSSVLKSNGCRSHPGGSLLSSIQQQQQQQSNDSSSSSSDTRCHLTDCIASTSRLSPGDDASLSRLTSDGLEKSRSDHRRPPHDVDDAVGIVSVSSPRRERPVLSLCCHDGDDNDDENNLATAQNVPGLNGGHDTSSSASLIRR